MGKIFYIIGKSATGKDTIYKNILETRMPGLERLVIYTTRPRREGEENGKEYYFTDIVRLNEMRQEKKIIEERTYHTVLGDWTYFTADDGQLKLETTDYLGIGTLESFEKLKAWFGNDKVCPIYVEVEDGTRLERAILREKQQKKPQYEEMCRRFLADAEDFSEEKLKNAGITKRFLNIDCAEVTEEILKYMKEASGRVE